MKPYRFHPDARAEFRAAAEWYDSRSAISIEFVGMVEAAIRRIRRNPRACPRWPAAVSAEIRRCVLRRFPFVVIYVVDDRGVLVLAVAHTSRDPSYWLRRIQR